MFLLYDVEETSWQSEESVLYNPAVLFSILLFVPEFYLYELASVRKNATPNSLNSRRVLRMVHLEQVRPSKTFPEVPDEFRVSGCEQESRIINPLGLGILMG